MGRADGTRVPDVHVSEVLVGDEDRVGAHLG